MYSGTTLPPIRIAYITHWHLYGVRRRGEGGTGLLLILAEEGGMHVYKLHLAAPAQTSLHPLKPRCNRSNVAAPVETSLKGV